MLETETLTELCLSKSLQSLIRGGVGSGGRGQCGYDTEHSSYQSFFGKKLPAVAFVFVHRGCVKSAEGQDHTEISNYMLVVGTIYLFCKQI